MTQVTPNLQLPYPEAGDPPSGDEQMQALAEAIDGQAVPERFNDFTMGDGYEPDGVQGAYYSLAWGRVWFYGALSATDGKVGSNDFVMTLPEAIWPESAHGFAVSIGSGAVGYIYIRTDGTMQIVFNTSVWSPGSWISLDGISYFVKTTTAAAT